jgi:dienelactone hydrolase
MASVARNVDHVVGVLSRLLHLRSAEHNTIDDLGPYLGAPPSVFFPTPVAPRDVVRRRSLLPRGGGRVVDTLEWHSQHVPLCPHYRVRHSGEYACNQRVTARWMHPRSGPRRAALLYVHGWLEPGPWIEEAVFLPRLYEALGVDVLHVQLPFHGARNPKGALFHGEYFMSADLVRSFEALRQSCTDARTAVAWLRDAGYTEVGVTGISLGGSIAMLLACLDPTPDYVVPICGHLQLAEAIEEAPILWRMKADLERFGIDREQRRRIFEQIAMGTTQPLLPPERQMWIMARDDVFIDRTIVERQWQAWGKPPIDWIPCGHMTFPLAIGRIVERARQFHETLPRQS